MRCICRRQYGFVSSFTSNPSWTCIVATSTGKYDTFLGNPSNITQVSLCISEGEMDTISVLFVRRS